MLILLILLDICLQGRSQTSVVYFTAGNNATLICPLNTSGEHIIWKKDDTVLNDANNKISPMILNYEKYRVVINESNRNILHIRMANDNEVGVYGCETTINNNFKTEYVRLVKKGIPQCLQSTIIEDGIQAKSTKIFIKLSSVPKYDRFHWKTSTESITNISTKYDTTVTVSHFTTVLYDDVSFEEAVWKFSLVIYDLNQDDFDIYTLQVANKIGKTSCSVRLKPTNFRDMKNMLYLGILTLTVILLLTFVICNICIHLHGKKLSRVPLRTGHNEVSEVNIEMTDINNGYHTINEEDRRQEDNEVENQAEIQSTNDSLADDSDDQSAESDADETGLRESDDYLNPYCTVIERTADVHNYETLAIGNNEREPTYVNLNNELHRSYKNLKF